MIIARTGFNDLTAPMTENVSFDTKGAGISGMSLATSKMRITK